MDYQYIGSTDNTKVIKGTVAATSQEAADKILTSQGYQIFSLKPVPAFMPYRKQLSSSFSNKMKPEVIIVFSRQLALLLESGNAIVTSLELLQAQSSHKHFKGIISEIISDLRGGSQLSTALGKHAKVFPKVYTQSVSVGEQGGGLETVLRQVADYMEKDAKAAKGIKGALKYPIMICVVAFIVIGVLVVFVLPAFTDLYSSLGTELPPLTRVTLSALEWLTSYGPYLMGGAFLAVILAYIYTRTPGGRLLRDKLILKIPMIGRSVHLNELIRCCRSMSLLYRAGLPVPGIMSMVVEHSNNLVIKNSLTQVQHGVLIGEGLSKSMAKSEYFLPMMVQMVGVGETTGNLDATLLATAETYEMEAEDKMHSLIGFIQPAVTLGIGIVVGFIALSLVTAMYSVYGQAF